MRDTTIPPIAGTIIVTNCGAASRHIDREMQQVVDPQNPSGLYDAEDEQHDRQRHEGEFYCRRASIVFKEIHFTES